MTDTATLAPTRQPADACLVAHAGTYKVDEDTVRAVVPPVRTETWHPISHRMLLDEVLGALTERGLVIDRREFSLSRDKHQLFSIFTMRGNDAIAKDFSLALGLRNSTNKTLPAGIVSGARVFVCDNLALTGDIVIKRKHTSGIEEALPGLIRSALDQWVLKAQEQATVFNRWKTIEIDSKVATDVIVRSAEAGALPQAGILPVRREFLNPRHAEFAGNTVWGLYNAYTQYLTHDRVERAPIRSQRDFLNVHQIMAKEFPLGN